MVDIAKQIKYWRNGSDEDLDASRVLLEKNKTRHGLFFVHLAVEKMAKACYCKYKQKEPPKIHNIVRISELTGLNLPDNIRKKMARINEFCLEGRYPWMILPPPHQEKALDYLNQANEIIEWLQKQL